jgi:hypothetical protein
MKRVLILLMLVTVAAPLAGCYVAPVGPVYGRPYAAVPVWIPGHWGPYGHWVPGHYA